MFRVTPNGANRLDIEFSGKLDSDDMKAAIDDMVGKAEDIEHGRMLYGVELSRLPKLFGLIRNFDRVAVLADKNWVKTASEIEGALIPGLEIKAFGSDEEEEAEAWLAED